VIDYYSRYYEIDIIKDISSEKIVDCLETMFARNGLPKTIKSVNGPPFVSKYVEQYLKDINVKHRKITPSSNGEVERQNRSLMKRIRIAQAESSNWKTEVRKYLVAYRTKRIL
jgi:hypothetical protein